MTTEQAYGFRYDPLKWAREDNSMEAAMVRLEFLDSASDGDANAIREKAEAYVRKLSEKMDLCNPPAMQHDLIQVACSHGLLDSAELGKLILRTAERDDDGNYDAYATIALCSIGYSGQPEVVRSVAQVAQGVMNDNPWQTCPWGMFLKLRALWLGRDATDVQEALEKQLDVVAGNSNEVGPFYDKDPISRVDICGIVEHPKTRAILEQSLPMILRGQLPDGGWGRRSFQIFRALHRNGMMGPLRELPPLPPVRSRSRSWLTSPSPPASSPKARSPLRRSATRPWASRTSTRSFGLRSKAAATPAAAWAWRSTRRPSTASTARSSYAATSASSSKGRSTPSTGSSAPRRAEPGTAASS